MLWSVGCSMEAVVAVVVMDVWGVSVLFSCVVWFVAPMLALLDHADLCSYSCESYIPHPPPTCRKHLERVIGIDIKVQENGLPITGLKLSSRFVTSHSAL